MKTLLIISIFIFCFFIGKINKKKTNISFLIAITAIFTPIIFLNKIDSKTFIAFIISLLFLFLFDLTKNKLLKIILFSITSIYFCLIILYLSGILSNNLEIDFQKIFLIDNSSFETIKRFQLDALYLPRILRPIIYSNFQIIIAIFARVVNYLWINKIFTFLGFAFLYLIYLAFINKKNRLFLIIPFLVILIGILHRDPNNYLIYLFSIPPLLLFFIKNINKINISILFSTILISCLYSFL